MLLPLNDLQGEIRGLMGRNVMRQQLQSGGINMPSVAGVVKDTGAVDFELGEGDEDSQGSHGNRPHSPQTVSSLAQISMTDFALSPLVLHYRPNKRDTPL